ncbi:serine hydrolase domain-containing protein [Acidipropionibacterium virtanenii]|uniref:Penicillin-binding protein 4 n=1 Tax=Acidipropionibacterium virtanenii TaxID=2057246 RepID=A0A344UQS9_9ACTN|nr:serine hydrolase domain-containing protein [Acidipropionibacterium virtanenii]AXE37627.1 Penicillin-binding protein 4* [Acidipropionibacterium virtanenii]
MYDRSGVIAFASAASGDFDAPSTDVVTVKMLLSNCSGLPEDNGWSDHNLDLPRAEFITLLRKGFQFTEPPGQTYQYSNVAFTVASMILEIVSGERYETFLNREILEPLGLDSTRYTDSHADPVDRGKVGVAAR